MAETTYRITLWSGGKPAMVHYVTESPGWQNGCLSFRTEDGSIIRLMGTISIEEGVFAERRISAR